jgi:hypothetical protein
MARRDERIDDVEPDEAGSADNTDLQLAYSLAFKREQDVVRAGRERPALDEWA